MMKMFSSAVGMFHGKSKTDSPYNNLHQLTAPDIDLKQFNFSSLAGEASHFAFLSLTLSSCFDSTFDFTLLLFQVVLVVNVASK